MPIQVGLTAEVELTVAPDDTAVEMRSGSVSVLATPRLVALCEEATCRALDGALAAGETSVGTQVQLNHVAPVAVGSTVTAEATLERAEGRRLTFTVSVNDASGLVAAGKVSRVVVDEERFLEKAR